MAVTENRLPKPLSSDFCHGLLRLGESLGLAWDDIDLEQKELRVRRALRRLAKQPGEKKSKRAFVEPKSERSRRTLGLPEVVVDAAGMTRLLTIPCLADRLSP